LARSSAGVVFERRTNLYGCTYRQHKVRVLRTCCTDLEFKVAGVYAGYAATGSAIGDESTKLGVFDLRTGKLRAIRKLSPNSEGGGREIDTNGHVTAFRLSKSGGLAWIQSNGHFDSSQPGPGTYGPDQELRAAAGAHPWERVVDTGSTDAGSLTKLRLQDGFVSWRNQGVARSTALNEGPYRGRCDKLKGTDVVRTDSLLIVKRPSHSFGTTEFVGDTFLGCALPAGVVYNLGRTGTNYLYNARTRKRRRLYGHDTAQFSNPAGTYVLRELSSDSTTAATQYQGDVVDIVHGVGNTYAEYNGGDPQTGPEPTAPASAVLSPTGVFAGIFGDGTSDGTGQHRVVALTPLGAKRVLDAGPEADIPASSLGVDGSTVRWTNAGAAKSAVVADGAGG
jgi:hypothetical protein